MKKFKYAVYGILFGLLFPIFALILRLKDNDIDHTVVLFKSDPLLWIIVTAPVVLGIFAFFIGLQIDRLQFLHNNLEDLVYQRTKQLEVLQESYVHSAKMAALGEMTGGIAHELNTPLAVILLHVDRLTNLSKNKDTPDPVLDKSLLVISKTIDRMSEIVRKLRSFSLLNNKEFASDELQDVETLVLKAFTFYEDKLKENGIEYSIINSNEPLLVCMSNKDFFQVMKSLIDNSIFALKRMDQKWIRIKIASDYNCVKISFADSGNGIPKDVASKIFQPFYTTKEVGEGMGLGLSSALGIIKAQKGLLEYLPAQNTSFLITLPKANLSK